MRTGTSARTQLAGLLKPLTTPDELPISGEEPLTSGEEPLASGNQPLAIPEQG